MIYGVLGIVLPLLGALLSFTWWLSSRMTRQNIFLNAIMRRLSRIEKHLGLSTWKDDD